MHEELTCPTCGKTFIRKRLGGKPQIYDSRRCKRIHEIASRPRSTRPTTAEGRYWSFVEIRGVNECWPWLGATTDRGYGVFYYGGGAADPQQTTAHRYGLSLKLGKPIDQLAPHALHSCDNPPCQNPAHLSEGTAKMNQDDSTAKGRRAAKLTPEVVREIRRLYSTGQYTQTEIALTVGIHQTRVSGVILRRNWKHND